ncbi:MAG: LLM class F420-dependent oxidoreductase [Pseudonocardia sp.]
MTFGIDTFITAEGSTPTALAIALEERSFDALLLTEHSHIPVRRESPWGGGDVLPDVYYRTFDPFVALAAAASVTTTLWLGTAVALVPQRDVIHLAKEVATLDHVSGGRALLGVGGGWNVEEMRNHGVDPATRGRLLNEKLAALREIWTKDQAEFHGELVDFDPIYAWPKPVQRPHPPIYVGGESRAALDRLVRFGNGWLPRARTTTPEKLRTVVAWFAEQGRADIRTTFCGAGLDRDLVAGVLEAGADRVTFTMPTAPQDEALRWLDELAEFVSEFR